MALAGLAPQDQDLEEQDAPDEVWQRQWELNHLRFAWGQIEQELAPLHAEAFRRCVFDEQPVKEVARQLGLSAENVYQIKRRVTLQLTQRVREIEGE